MYQVFILLLGHLPFFLLFFFTFMENFFLRQSLPWQGKGTDDHLLPLDDWFCCGTVRDKIAQQAQ